MCNQFRTPGMAMLMFSSMSSWSLPGINSNAASDRFAAKGVQADEFVDGLVGAAPVAVHRAVESVHEAAGWDGVEMAVPGQEGFWVELACDHGPAVGACFISAQFVSMQASTEAYDITVGNPPETTAWTRGLPCANQGAIDAVME